MDSSPISTGISFGMFIRSYKNLQLTLEDIHDNEKNIYIVIVPFNV